MSEYDLIDCDACSRECEECHGTGVIMAIGNEGDEDCNFCDGTGDNQDNCSRCNETGMMAVPKGVGY